LLPLKIEVARAVKKQCSYKFLLCFFPALAEIVRYSLQSVKASRNFGTAARH